MTEEVLMSKDKKDDELSNDDETTSQHSKAPHRFEDEGKDEDEDNAAEIRPIDEKNNSSDKERKQRSARLKVVTRKVQNDEADKRTPLDGGWGWMIVLGAAMGHFFLVGLARTLGVFFVHWYDRFEGSAVATSWVQSFFNTVRMVIGPIVSILCDMFGARIVVMIGGFVFGVACVVSAFADSLEYLYISFSLFGGLGAGCLFTTMFIMVNQYFDKKEKSTDCLLPLLVVGWERWFSLPSRPFCCTNLDIMVLCS